MVAALIDENTIANECYFDPYALLNECRLEACKSTKDVNKLRKDLVAFCEAHYGDENAAPSSGQTTLTLGPTWLIPSNSVNAPSHHVSGTRV